MKQLLLAVLLGLAPVLLVSGQPIPTYQNDGIVEVPPQIAPQIDATNFINNGNFDINLDAVGNFSGSLFFSFTTPLYEMADTLNFKNNTPMSSDTGFLFDTADGGVGGNGG